MKISSPLSIIFAVLLVLPTSSCGPGANSNANSLVNGAKGNTNGMSFKKSLPGGFNEPGDDAGRKLLEEYGAVFVARGGAVPPKTVIFKDEAEVTAFQSSLQTSRESIDGFDIELQAAAMTAWKNARGEAGARGLKITPRSADSARRSYRDTVELWASRVEPALAHWVEQGKLDPAEAERIRGLRPFEQVPEVFKLESKGIYFAKSLDKSIIYSVAPPGASQHLSMLALDIAEYDEGDVIAIMKKNGWYRTVVSDLPHFTFLGVPENELPGLGLKMTVNGGRAFWVPDI